MLPYAEEIRAARAEAETASRAQLHLQRLAALEHALAMVTQLAEAAPPSELPGEDLVAEVREAWDLPLEERGDALVARRGTFARIRAALEEVAATAPQRIERLRALQQAQAEELEREDLAAVVGQVRELEGLRQNALAELQPLNQRMVIAAATIDSLAGFVRQLEREIAGRNEPDPTGRLAWRAASRSVQLLRGLASTLVAVKLDVPLAEPSPLPAAAPEHAAALWQVAEGARSQLEEARARLLAEHAALSTRVAALGDRSVDLLQRIRALTG